MTQKILSDAQIVDFFKIDNLYNTVHKDHGLRYDTDIAALLKTVATQYDYGGDNIFWILNQHYIESRDDGWYIERVPGQTDDDQAAYIIAQYYSEDLNVAETLTLWGLDKHALDSLTPAKSNADYEVMVWIRRWYTPSTIGIGPQSFLATDDDDQAIIFDSYIDAKKWIDEADSGDYVCSNGEMARPDYYIVDAE